MGGHVPLLGETRNAQKDMLRKPGFKRQFRRPRHRQDDVKMDLKNTRWGSVGGSYMTENGNVYWGLRKR